MKFLILLLIGSLIVVAKAATKEELRAKFAEECNVTATDKEIEEFLRNNLDPSYNTKCLRKCLFLKHNVMDIENKFNVQKAAEFFEKWYDAQDDKQNLVIATECSALPVVNDSCEAAHAFFKCGIEGITKQSLPTS